MSLQEASNAALEVRRDGWKHPHCIVAYLYSRGCYGVVVAAANQTTVLIDAEAVRTYRANHRPEWGV